MRYALEFVDDPFGPAADVGIELQDEEPIVVPEECPDCPECPAACEPECYGWTFARQDFPDLAWAASNYQRTCPEPAIGLATQFGAISIIADSQRCGHKTRIIYSTSPPLPAPAIAKILAADGISEIGLTVGVYFDGDGNDIFVKQQIDLNDDDTWTDFCCQVTVLAGAG